MINYSFFRFIILIGDRLVDVRDEITSMFDDVIQIAASSYSPNDKARMTISHGDLQEEVFVHLQNVENLNGEAIMDRFERVLNSHQDMKADESFGISVGLLRLNKGGGRRRLPLHPHLNDTPDSAILNKRSIVNILPDEDGDNYRGEQLCAAKSIVVANAKLKTLSTKSEKNERKIRRFQFINLIKKDRQLKDWPNGLKQQAIRLQAKTGLPIDRPLTVRDLAQFEEHVEAKIIVVQFIENQVEPVITPCSDSVFDKQIFLYLSGNHYHAIVNIDGMFRDMKLCRKCFTTYPPKQHNAHPCNSKKCIACGRLTCEMDAIVFCPDCNMTCRSMECYNVHKRMKDDRNRKKKSSLSVCERTKKCLVCMKLVDTRKLAFDDHVCGTYQCGYCDEWVDTSHLCFLRRKAMRKTSGTFLFFDFETMQDSIFQCDEGYSSKDVSGEGCGQKIEGGGRCSAGNRCQKCKLCLNCKKTNCGRIVHQPNFVVAETCCDLCKDDVLTPESSCSNCGDLCHNCRKQTDKRQEPCIIPGCGKRRVIFRGFDTTYDFCSWLISPLHKNFTCVAHNGKAYDFSFVLNYLVTEAHITPHCVFAGAKLMGMEVKDGLNIRFLDSLNFMGMALKKLPKAFGLRPEQLGMENCDVEELAKLPFPHEFNTRENFHYKGAYPPLEMYGIESMSENDRVKVIEWYESQRGKEFDMQQQLETYCTVDTSILRLACMTFRQLIIDVTSAEADDGEVNYVDCFAHLTIASTVMQCFRLNFIEEYHDVKLTDGQAGIASFKGGKWYMGDNVIGCGDIQEQKFRSSNLAQVPSHGYVRNSNHSKKSIAWLEFESRRLGRQIIHARNYGEHRVRCGENVYSLDGYDPINQVAYEFYGCKYHGCLHYEDRKVRDPRTGFSMDDLHKQTLLREVKLRQAGLRVKSIYECAFDRMAKVDPELAQFLENEFDTPPRLVMRDAFYGGRTSGFKLHHKCDEDEEIHYVDVCSLYPFINKMARMPVGHPKIITRNFDTTFQSYFGIAHLKVLPPRNEYLPILPVRVGGKLTFPLCRKCAANEQQEECNHEVSERALTGVWCTPEIAKAIEKGYQVLCVYEVYHYENSTQHDPVSRKGGLFAEQVDLFLKLKAQASGYPEWVRTEQDRDSYITEFESKCGVKLDKEKIEVNPALRSISKICLNAFWGKFGERQNKVKTKFFSDSASFMKLASDTKFDLVNFHIINEDTMVVEYKNAHGFEEESGITNEIIAAFTTCFARLELYKHMESVGRNLLYVDTDSLIFVSKKRVGSNGEIVYENFPPVGNSLGELTNELKPNTYIQEFVCTAPKSYAFRTSDGVECVKFKGISLNEKNKQRINFQGVKDLVFGIKQKICTEPEIQFKRSKFEGIITNATLVKTASNTYNKRRVLQNFDTVPFGYTV